MRKLLFRLPVMTVLLMFPLTVCALGQNNIIDVGYAQIGSLFESGVLLDVGFSGQADIEIVNYTKLDTCALGEMEVVLSHVDIALSQTRIAHYIESTGVTKEAYQLPEVGWRS